MASTFVLYMHGWFLVNPPMFTWYQVKIIGSYGARARQDLPQIVKLAESGAFNLQNTISRKCKFEEANGAYEDLNQGKIVGRAVVEIME